MTEVYKAIAAKIAALRNPNITEGWRDSHEFAVAGLVRDYLPSGSGFDAGTQFDIDANVDDKRDRLTFSTAFHHMDQHGGYDGWTSHTVTVWPTWQGIDLKVSGRDRNGIKEYIAEAFYDALNRQCE